MRKSVAALLVGFVVAVVVSGAGSRTAAAQKPAANENVAAVGKKMGANDPSAPVGKKGAPGIPTAGKPKGERTSSLPEAKVELLSAVKIWSGARHNGFPDLVRFKNTWYCCCREGDDHVGGANGKVRLIASSDGVKWEPVALLAEEGVDLRDPKLSETADGRLMLVMGGSVFRDGDSNQLVTMQPRVAFSTDGREWTALRKVLEEKHWLWRVTWHEGRAYGISKVKEEVGTRGFLYTSTDGVDWKLITELKPGGNYVSETTLRFTPEGRMVALIRPGYIGVSSAPYTEWSYKQVPAKLSGPNLARRDDGTWWATTRGNGPLTEAEKATTKKTVASRTLLAQVSTAGEFRTALILPSAGDTGYTGLVLDGDVLWIAYYASHEGQGIYLAKVRFEK